MATDPTSVPPPLYATRTASLDIRYAVCNCCRDHSTPDRPLLTTMVTCPECGAPCSCEGCVADAELADA